MEEILNFINEKLPVIISYVLIVLGYIYQFFIKTRVKKNYNLFHNIVKNEARENEARSRRIVDSTVDELKKAKEALIKEKERLEKEYAELKNKVEAVTQACQLLVADSEHLIKNGMASQVLKLIPVNDINTLKEVYKKEKENEDGSNISNK